MLVGNKLDLVNKKEKERQVTEEEAINMCNKFNMIWGGEISAKEIDYNELMELIKKFIVELYKKIGVATISRIKKYERPKQHHINKCIIY